MGKVKTPALGVARHHHLGKGLVEHVHFVLKLTVGGIAHVTGDDHGLVPENAGHLQIHSDIGKRGSGSPLGWEY